jgi:cytochrome c556
MRRLLIPFAAVLFVAACATSLAQCKKAPAATAAPDYELIGTIHDLMEGIVDPASDVLFDAVATDITAAGVHEKRPQTDEEWEHVESNALMLAEAANLLKMPGRKVAPPGVQTKSEGPDAPELTAEEIQAKIDADRTKFINYATNLQEQARKTYDAAKKKDADSVFALGEDIDMACEDCHLEYWYPNDTAAKAAALQAKADREKERQQKAAEGQKK